MRKIREREEKILRQIEQLETLRPRYNAVDEGLTHYAYNRRMAAIKVICIASMAAGFTVAVADCFCPIKDCIVGKIALIVVVLAMAIFFYLPELKGKTYLLATKRTVKMLDRKFAECQAEIERLEQRQRDAEFYQPKFERLEPLITQELKGTYLLSEKYHFVRIGFGKYTPENYKLNEKEYAKLIWRIVETRHQPGMEDELTNFIREFENSLSA